MKRKMNLAAVATVLMLAAQVTAQTFPIEPGTRQTEVQEKRDGFADEVLGIVDTSVGDIGRRQAREDVAPNMEPLRRLNNRIENRIQNRLRNRVDRSYDQTANTTAPFERAQENSRTGSRRRPR